MTKEERYSQICEKGLTRFLVACGAKVMPVLFDTPVTFSTSAVKTEYDFQEDDIKSLMNPSVAVGRGGRILCCVRGVNYDFIVNPRQRFTWTDQPTVYVNNRGYLGTVNFLAELDPSTLMYDKVYRVHTYKFDTEPKWTFRGLEDARLVFWNDRPSLCGVRRDVQADGQGRMELSGIIKDAGFIKETSRIRIPMPPALENSYCEKNWMPVSDRPDTWIRWVKSGSVCVAVYDRDKDRTVFHNVKGIEFESDQEIRGGSQLVWYGGSYWAFVHTCKFTLLNKKTRSRRGVYKHRLIRFSSDLSLEWISPEFSFSPDFTVEFCCGLAVSGGTAYVSYSEDDSVPIVLKFDADLLLSDAETPEPVYKKPETSNDNLRIRPKGLPKTWERKDALEYARGLWRLYYEDRITLITLGLGLKECRLWSQASSVIINAAETYFDHDPGVQAVQVQEAAECLIMEAGGEGGLFTDIAASLLRYSTVMHPTVTSLTLLGYCLESSKRPYDARIEYIRALHDCSPLESDKLGLWRRILAIDEKLQIWESDYTYGMLVGLWKKYLDRPLDRPDDAFRDLEDLLARRLGPGSDPWKDLYHALCMRMTDIVRKRNTDIEDDVEVVRSVDTDDVKQDFRYVLRIDSEDDIRDRRLGFVRPGGVIGPEPLNKRMKELGFMPVDWSPGTGLMGWILKPSISKPA